MTRRVYFSPIAPCAFAIWLAAASPTWAANVKVAPATDHPASSVEIKGAKFGASEPIDVYFDTTDELLVVANGRGAFRNHGLIVPSDALPGTHWITAIGRHSGDSVQKPFTVRTDWPEFRMSDDRDGLNPYENVISTSNVASLNTDWVAATTAEIFLSSPTVANGIVYIGSIDANLYAFNADTGSLIWKAPTDGPIDSSAAVANGVVYIGSINGSLYAFNAATGSPVWTASEGTGIETAPTVVNGIVYVSSDDKKLDAFDASTGTALWTTTTGSLVESSPTVANGAVYVGTYDGYLYIFDASTGATRCVGSSVDGGVINSTPAVANGFVYAATDNGTESRVYAWDASNCGLIWDSYVEGQPFYWASPSIANGVVYFVGTNENYTSYVSAFKASNGSQLWTAIVLGNIAYSSPAVADGVVYVGADIDYYGELYALDASNGAELWSAVTGASILSSPSVTNGVVYVGAGDGDLYAYALNRGKNAVYRTRHSAPAISNLQPDWRLTPAD